jgi:hypothetical protein
VNLQSQIKSFEETYGVDNLHLTVAKGYVGKLLANARVVRWFRSIVTNTSVSFRQSRRFKVSEAARPLLNETDGDPDPISAGTAGEAALWGGSSAAVGMAANPFGAH